jgi:hypothetical protein
VCRGALEVGNWGTQYLARNIYGTQTLQMKTLEAQSMISQRLECVIFFSLLQKVKNSLDAV